jgi:hypothetical protein
MLGSQTTGVEIPWFVLEITGSATCMNAPGDSARHALAPGLADRTRIGLERANSVDRALGRVVMVVGRVATS